MKLLLDTCAFLWLATDAPELSSAARLAFEDPQNDVFLSTVSGWEIAVKYRAGRLPLLKPPEDCVPALRARLGVQILPLLEEASLHAARLPDLHRDPFDRMLVCQAFVHDLVVVTPDRAIVQYAVRSLW